MIILYPQGMNILCYKISLPTISNTVISPSHQPHCRTINCAAYHIRDNFR